MSSFLPARLRALLFPAARTAFRLVPMSQQQRDRLRNQILERFHFMLPASPRGKSGDISGTSRRAITRANEPAIGHVAYRQDPLPERKARLIAFYLPQFHAIPENDAWWGPGFTEWRNVSNALPQFEGHSQPRLPADLGFYDLRNVQVMHQQAKLAREYGIEGFCFYFYWFAGKTLLEAPLEHWLSDTTLEMPLCLCWANERWARNWDGRSGVTLIQQNHSEADDLDFISHIARYLTDSRYLRVDGRPMLIVYRPELFPDMAATAQRWRQWCRDHEVGEIHLAYVQGFERPLPSSIGFDAAIEFPPNLSNPNNLTARQQLLNPAYEGNVLDWRELAAEMSERPLPKDYVLYSGVNPGWDNEARRAGKGRTYLHASPRGYRDWLRKTIDVRLEGVQDNARLVFINAWNEWAEGAVLEPDLRLGHAWLQATRDALRLPPPINPRPHAVIHAWYGEALEEILHALTATGLTWHVVVTTTAEKREEIRTQLERSALSWEISVFENRGRDILPFLHVANRLLDAGIPWVLKLHTKRSVHRNDGADWQRDLLDRLVNQRAQGIAEHLANDTSIGLVAPEGHVLRLSEFMGSNAQSLEFLRARAGLSALIPEETHFVSGSMYWVRLEALRPLLDAHLLPSEFEDEDGQIDGTLAHAVERLIAHVVTDAGSQTTTAASLLGVPAPAPGSEYQYARRG